MENFGWKILVQTHSKINGDIKIIEQFGIRKLMVEGYTQSKDLDHRGKTHGYWDAFYDLPSDVHPTSALILGLGAGTIVTIWKKLFPALEVTTVEIDPVIADLYQNYFNPPPAVEVIIGNAVRAVLSQDSPLHAKKFDLICVDVYRGGEFDSTCESERFLSSLEKLTNTNGLVMCNRIYAFNEGTKQARFVSRLSKYFDQVECKKPSDQITSFNVIIRGRKRN